MKIYKGTRKFYNVQTKKDEMLVTVQDNGGEPKKLTPDTSQKFFNHSPDGFEWGYAGSGPAQLALAILLDVTRNAKLAVTFHQEFKRQFVASWKEDWSIDSDKVRAWLGEQILKKYGNEQGKGFCFDDTQRLYTAAVISNLYSDDALDHLAEQLHEIDRERHVSQDEARMHRKENEK